MSGSGFAAGIILAPGAQQLQRQRLPCGAGVYDIGSTSARPVSAGLLGMAMISVFHETSL